MPIHELPLTQFLARLLIGMFLGLLIGYERQWKQRPAGLHTTALVATGAALYASIEPAFSGGGGDRVLANIVTGVGFLAGGVILREGGTVSGLNTAATIWSTAAVGALAGLALFREAAVAALAIVAMNLVMEPIARRIDRREEIKRHAR
jgi:putative Mg2+ transporter-C (MgtC) family protein